jgi:2-iminobutanoate/2-iminopropanoate deaminase
MSGSALKQLVRTPNATQPFGPYSQGVIAGNLLFVAGQGATDPKTGQMAEGIEAQTHQTLANIKGIVEASGFSMRDVVKVSIFLRNMDDFKRVNEVYKTFFPEDPPARTTVEAKLPVQGMLIEIDVIAYRE